MTLEQKIKDAQWAYYNSTPILSDAAYDALLDELKRLDPNNLLLTTVGAPVVTAWKKFQHVIAMGSLNKAQSIEEFLKWCQLAGLTAEPLVASEKLDGISLSLGYLNRKFIRGVTRGDGVEGEDITRNVSIMQGVVKMLPPVINAKPTPEEVWIRGEIVCRHQDFATHFKGESNPRNTASGTAKRIENYEKCQHLTVMPYVLDLGFEDKLKEFQTLKEIGFTTPKFWPVTYTEIANHYQRYIDGDRSALDYDIDGIVVEVRDKKVFIAKGESDGRPKAAVALKFPHDSKATVLRNVRWQVGNSGRVTPVAEFDGVELVGAVVEKASLHNVTRVQKLKLSEGCSILVARAGDVIPAVEANLTLGISTEDEGFDKTENLDWNPNGFQSPEKCPVCNYPLEREGEYLVCRSEDCPAQVSGSIRRWIKKLNILHFGDSIIEACIEAGFIVDIADLYDLNPDEVSDLEMSGRVIGQSAYKAIKNLNAKKALALPVFVGSLGIPLWGASMVQVLVDAGYNSLLKLYEAKASEIAEIPGIGDIKAKAFVEGLEAKLPLITKILEKGVTIQSLDGRLSGKSFCMTGFRSAELQDAIEKAGGTIKSGVSKELTYLIALEPNSTSGKAEKARSYGVTVVSVEEAWEILNDDI